MPTTIGSVPSTELITGVAELGDLIAEWDALAVACARPKVRSNWAQVPYRWRTYRASRRRTARALTGDSCCRAIGSASVTSVG